jgi:hypothetical protein
MSGVAAVGAASWAIAKGAYASPANMTDRHTREGLQVKENMAVTLLRKD